MRNNALKNFATWPIKFYRFWISPLLGNNCRFHPSCSKYALEAIERHGSLKGLFLAAWRLMRCHPWGGRGFHDPVPESFDWRHLFRYKRPQS